MEEHAMLVAPIVIVDFVEHERAAVYWSIHQLQLAPAPVSRSAAVFRPVVR